MDYKITQEQAIAEFERWLKVVPAITPLKRDSESESEEVLVEQIRLGNLIVDDDNKLTLIFPEAVGEYSQVTFENRIHTKDVRAALRTVSSKDELGRAIAVAARMSSIRNTAIWDKIDYSVTSIVNLILGYFL